MRLALILFLFCGLLCAHDTPEDCFIKSSVFGNVAESTIYSNMDELTSSFVNGMSLHSIFFCNGTAYSDIALT